MPYMAIGSLEDVIHNKRKSYDDTYTEKQKTTWITQICRGLSHLHTNKIIHRDLKPGESYNDVKLSDFGIARSVANMTHSLTTRVGTQVYMAPEIFRNEAYTFSADIYSLSITIWEILYRRTPYDHITSKFDLLYQISKGKRPELKDDLSEKVSYLLTSCWSDDATERPEINVVLEFYSNTELTLSKLMEIIPKKQTILLLGGEDGMNRGSLLLLENNGQNWKLLNIKLPYAVYSHGAQFLNNNLYIFGGYNEEDEILNWTYKLSKSLEWTKMADMNEKRYGISNSSVILNNQIWVCGGRDNSVEMYDPETNKWKYMKSMNENRLEAAAAVVNGKIFCSGGLLVDSVECYDPSSDVWTRICKMPQDIWRHSAVEMDGNLIIMGGYNRKSLNSVWALDTTDTKAKWIKKSFMPIPRTCFSIAKINGKIFVCGGNEEDRVVIRLDEVEIFDGEVWRNGSRMPTIRSGNPAVVIPVSFARYLK